MSSMIQIEKHSPFNVLTNSYPINMELIQRRFLVLRTSVTRVFYMPRTRINKCIVNKQNKEHKTISHKKYTESDTR